MRTRLVDKNHLVGIIGFPVDHSLSPDIFHWIAKRVGVSLQYHRLPISGKNLKTTLSVLQGLGIFSGWNVTLPHKQRIISYIDQLSVEAKMIGAVNVVKRDSRGRLKGFNTDFLGIQQTLEEQKWEAPGQSALIIGAGGAAFAVGAVLGKNGATRVQVVNRNLDRSRNMSRRLTAYFPKTRFEPIAWNEFNPKNLNLTSLIVNATPLGMKGFPGGKFEQFFDKKLCSNALAFDLIYKPTQTPFMELARKKGIRTVGGLDMLIWQALKTWEIWFGEETPVFLPSMKKDLKKFLKPILK